MSVAIIVAVDQHNAIGKDGGLLCHLPADLRHFKAVTMGHSLVMGRKTFESFPRGPLPGRQNIVVTRNPLYHPQGVTVAHSVREALAAATMPGDVFVIGGASVYEAALPLATTLHLTRIEAAFAGADTFFPAIDPAGWTVVARESHPADDRNPHPFTFLTLRRKYPLHPALWPTASCLSKIIKNVQK